MFRNCVFAGLAVHLAFLTTLDTVHAQPTDPCDEDLMSTYGCWESIANCPPENVHCAVGFPNMQAVHAILTYTGKVLMYRQSCVYECRGSSLWDPETNEGIRFDSGTDDLFCSGHVVLDDGRVFIAGGDSMVAGGQHCEPPVPIHSPRGRKDAWIFDPNPSNPGWTEVDQMSYERWYPTVTLLPNGKALVTSGKSCNVLMETPELYDPVAETWTELTSATNDRYGPEWYPWMHVLTNGTVLHAGPHRSQSTPPKMETLVAESGNAWQDFGSSLVAGSGSVMYVSGNAETGAKAKLLKTSHTHRDSINTNAEIVVEDGTRSSTGSLNHARRRHDHVVLPDGTVLVAGGAKHKNEYLTDAVKETELWDPGTGSWSLLAPSPVDRMYHGTTLLLPDGRLLSASGEYFVPGSLISIKNHTADSYSPPYLYKNNTHIDEVDGRPVVQGSVPALVACGTTFQVTVTPPSGTSIDSERGACFIRPGAVTHSNNMEQRYIPLSFSSQSSGNDEVLTISAPTSAEEAPPGISPTLKCLFEALDGDQVFSATIRTVRDPQRRSPVKATGQLVRSAGEVVVG